MKEKAKKIGLIINPAAGLGGSLGYKGSDGLYEKLLLQGADTKVYDRVAQCLKVLEPVHGNICIYTGDKDLGESLCKKMGFETISVYSYKHKLTRKEDTISLAKKLKEMQVDLLIFAGGDGTARDIYESVGDSIMVLGIPAGVKMHSAVYAINPVKGGQLALDCIKNVNERYKLSEVMDIDEDAFRRGKVTAKLYGYLKTPYDRNLLQSKKAGRTLSEGSRYHLIALHVIDNMEKDVYYIIGSGSTTKALKDALCEESTLLGVDVFYNKELAGRDLSEKQILKLVEGKKAKIVITPIGGQGHILGRGNQQLSPDVIKKVGKENIIVISSIEKIIDLQNKPLLTDVGDSELDKALSGYIKIIVGYNESVIYPVQS